MGRLYLHDALHISDTRLCILRSERARLHSAGRERLDIVWDGTGTVFNLIALVEMGRELIYLNGTRWDWL